MSDIMKDTLNSIKVGAGMKAMEEHDKLVEKAEAAIRAVFDDTSVLMLETRNSLDSIIEGIVSMMDTLKYD